LLDQLWLVYDMMMGFVEIDDDIYMNE